MIAALSLAPLAAVSTLTGCEEKKPDAGSSTAPKADDHGHDHGPSGEYVAPKAGHGGPVIALGEQTIGSFSAKTTRDQGQIVAGKDAPIDVTVTPAAGAAAMVVAVRLWIGTQYAKGLVKAKAEIEDPKDPTAGTSMPRSRTRCPQAASSGSRSKTTRAAPASAALISRAEPSLSQHAAFADCPSRPRHEQFVHARAVHVDDFDGQALPPQRLALAGNVAQNGCHQSRDRAHVG